MQTFLCVLQKQKLSWALDFHGCHLCRTEQISYHEEVMSALFYTASVEHYFRGWFDVTVQPVAFKSLSARLGSWFGISDTDGASAELSAPLPKAHVHFAVPPSHVS